MGARGRRRILFEIMLEIWPRRATWVSQTVNRVLLDNLHHSNDAGNFAVGVVEEGVVSFLHVPHEIFG